MGLSLSQPNQLPQHTHVIQHFLTRVLIALLPGPRTQELLGVRNEREYPLEMNERESAELTLSNH